MLHSQWFVWIKYNKIEAIILHHKKLVATTQHIYMDITTCWWMMSWWRWRRDGDGDGDDDDDDDGDGDDEYYYYWCSYLWLRPTSSILPVWGHFLGLKTQIKATTAGAFSLKEIKQVIWKALIMLFTDPILVSLFTN